MSPPDQDSCSEFPGQRLNITPEDQEKLAEILSGGCHGCHAALKRIVELEDGRARMMKQLEEARTLHHAEMSAALENVYCGKSKSIPPDWLIRAMEDKARLDWLEETAFKIQINQRDDEDFEVKWGDLYFYGKTLRLAIDFAMKKAQ